MNDTQNILNQIDKTRIPQHIAIIMDGNGRWAQQQGKERIYGHQSGVESVRQASEAAAEIGVKNLTLYAFSTENWNRPKEEVQALMGLLVETINAELETLNKNKISLKVIGDVDSLGEEVKKKLQKTIDATSQNNTMNLYLALSYSGRWEITQAVKKIAAKALEGNLKIDEITEKTISENMDAPALPDPELMIRTSGEERISNFLLWQVAYTELYFTPVLWPDFKKIDLFKAILDFQQRERRFGKTSEQI